MLPNNNILNHFFYSLTKSAPSPPSQTPYDRGKGDRSPSPWTERKTTCGLLKWNSKYFYKVQYTHKYLLIFFFVSFFPTFTWPCDLKVLSLNWCPVLLNLPGSLDSPNTTQMWTTCPGVKGRKSWGAPGASPLFVTFSPHWRITMNVKNIKRKVKSARQRWTSDRSPYCPHGRLLGF